MALGAFSLGTRTREVDPFACWDFDVFLGEVVCVDVLWMESAAGCQVNEKVSVCGGNRGCICQGRNRWAVGCWDSGSGSEIWLGWVLGLVVVVSIQLG